MQEKCLVKVEYPACYVRKEVKSGLLFLQRNPYMGECRGYRIELVPSSDGSVRVYIDGNFWKEVRGCVK